MTLTVAFDGPDTSGKSTLVAKVKKVLESIGLRVGMVNHPSSASETGQFARRQLVMGMNDAVVAQAMCKDFEYTLQFIVPQYDVVLLDRWAPVTIANQGEAGKEEVFRSNICNLEGAPQIYVSMQVDYETAVKRTQKRLAEQGVDWDESVSAKLFVSPEAWQAACERYKYAFQILTEGGNKFDWLQFDETSDPAMTTLTIATHIAERWARTQKAVAA